jgi:enamine deaminase RidA (YjgF/YER057c/UK114 family)
MNPEEKIKSLGLVLPPAPKPVGSYQPVVVAGNLAFLSGQIAKTAEGKILAGKVGSDLSLDQGREAARACALNVLSIIKNLVGFERFERMLRVVGYVQAAPDFYEIPQVMNAASDLFVDVFGEKGIHARSAVGMASLPLNTAVEIEVTLEVKA